MLLSAALPYNNLKKGEGTPMSEFSHLKNKLLAEQVEDEIYHYMCQ